MTEGVQEEGEDWRWKIMSSYGTKVKSEAQKNLRRVEEVEKKKRRLD